MKLRVIHLIIHLRKISELVAIRYFSRRKIAHINICQTPSITSLLGRKHFSKCIDDSSTSWPININNSTITLSVTEIGDFENLFHREEFHVFMWKSFCVLLMFSFHIFNKELIASKTVAIISLILSPILKAN